MTTPAEAPVTEEKKVARRPRPGEWIIAAVLLAMFAGGYLAAQDWPLRAALFPRMASVLGLGLTALRFIELVGETVRARRAPAEAVIPGALGPGPIAQDGAATDESFDLSHISLVDEEAEDDESIEYVFATAGRRAWIEALVWIAVFFVGFFVLGAFLSVPLFALAYLRISGKASWLAAAIYAAVIALVIYLVFRELIFVPLPESVFPFLRF